MTRPAPVPRRLDDFFLSHRTHEAWEAVIADLRRATRTVEFEQYILGDDEIGNRVLDLLAERARAGVRVRLLLDAFGSRAVMDSDGRRRLEAAGGEVRFYNPLSFGHVVGFPPRVHRDHRKLVVVDGETAWLGGICFQDRMRDWRDTFLRLEGSVIEAMADLFEVAWQHAGTGKGLRERRKEEPERPYRDQRGPFRYLVNSPEPPICRELAMCLTGKVTEARRSLRLATPYFVPEHRLLRYLLAAHRRGVEVTLLLPGVSDHPPLDILSRAFADRLARAGCRVFFYRDRMMHAKIALVDDAWASVSSLNLDRLSTRLNLENGVVCEDPAFIAALAEQFDRDIGDSDDFAPEPTPWHPVVDPLLRLAGRLL